jgi:hypothetical protein
MADRREPSHPPSDPHPGLARADSLLAGEDRPVRAQLIAALLLGLVLVASGLYLWRRPHADGESASSEPASSSSSEPAPVIGDAGLLAAVPEAGASGPVSLSDVRTLACQDRGSKKTAPDQCDRLTPVEQALSSAINQAAACVPGTAGGGTIEYVADVSFSRHKLGLVLPRGGRSVSDKKVLRACSTAVHSSLKDLSLDGIDHQHARYSIAVTATYRSSATGG